MVEVTAGVTVAAMAVGMVAEVTTTPTAIVPTIVVAATPVIPNRAATAITAHTGVDRSRGVLA
jgi:hypothetical protein